MKTSVKTTVIKRKKYPLTFKDRMGLVRRFLLVCLLAPFYYGWKALAWFLNWFYDIFLTEVYKSGSNDIIGPGYRSWGHSRLSWGKLAFLTVIIFIILYLIFK